MRGRKRQPERPSEEVVELTRVQPIDAAVIVARLRAAGVPAIVGADSVYPSLTIAYGVPIFVSAEDLKRAQDVLQNYDKDA